MKRLSITCALLGSLALAGCTGTPPPTPQPPGTPPAQTAPPTPATPAPSSPSAPSPGPSADPTEISGSADEVAWRTAGHLVGALPGVLAVHEANEVLRGLGADGKDIWRTELTEPDQIVPNSGQARTYRLGQMLVVTWSGEQKSGGTYVTTGQLLDPDTGELVGEQLSVPEGFAVDMPISTRSVDVVTPSGKKSFTLDGESLVVLDTPAASPDASIWPITAERTLFSQTRGDQTQIGVRDGAGNAVGTPVLCESFLSRNLSGLSPSGDVVVSGATTVRLQDGAVECLTAPGQDKLVGSVVGDDGTVYGRAESREGTRSFSTAGGELVIDDELLPLPVAVLDEVILVPNQDGSGLVAYSR